MKNLMFLCIFVAVFAIAFTSCEKNEKTDVNKLSESSFVTLSSAAKAPSNNNDLSELLSEKFGIAEKTPIDDFEKSGLSEFLKDVTDVLEFYNEKFSEERILLLKHSTTDDYSVIKGFVKDKKFNVTKNLSVNIKMDKEGMGYIKVADNMYDKGFKSELAYGKPVVVQKPLDPFDPNVPLQVRWCQREAGESTVDCYIREVGEFCDGFWGCAALATNKSIHLLILAMCSC